MTTFYVATTGRDTWSGTLAAPNAAGTDGPFATITAAQKAVRQAVERKQPVTVQIRGGRYTLTRPLRFTSLDGGTPEAPVTYEAFPGEKPVFSGGQPVTGWNKGDGELWVADLPEVKAGQWYFNQLFVKGERRTRARTPNEGYLRIAGTLEPLGDREAARRNPATKQGFRYTPGDLAAWKNPDDVTIVLYHAWTASLQWIKELDDKEHTARFTAPCGWPVGWWEASQRYHVENYFEALDSPGEWYLDRAEGRLYYWPLPGEDMTKVEAMAPRLQHLVEIVGDAYAGLPVENLTLRGLSFQHADWLHDRNRPADGQAAIHRSAAVVASGARNCLLDDCEIAHVGEYAVILGEGCKNNKIVHCHLHDMGGGGVRVGETNLWPEPERQTDHNVVDNCFIHDGGNVFRAGIGVWVGRSSYNTVSHNEICDFNYSGCSVGWSWGYAASSANHNLFEYNHIHDVGKAVLSDLGGIYSLGVSPGTVERFNLVHDCYSYSYGGWGLYTDEGSSDILLENNVVYNTRSGGFHQHYGQRNLIRNNVFAFAMEDNIKSSRSDLPNSLTFEQNLVLTNNGIPLGGRLEKPNFTLRSNLYWDYEGNEPDFYGQSLKQWQALGKDEGSIIADPLCVDPARYDFRLREGSPALKLGFKSIDISTAGLYGSPEWVDAPKKIVRKPVVIPQAEPQKVADDFEDTAVGQLPGVAKVSGETNGASIRVSDETAASGKHSLKFTDAPGLAHNWQPHMVYSPRQHKGVARLEFSVRREKGAILWQEWRDAASPYRVGPSLRIDENGALRAGSKVLTTLPLGQWIKLQVICGLGKDCTGDYQVTVTVPGQAPQTFEKLPLGSAQFRWLDWLGFVSEATETTVFYLDDLKLEVDDRQ